MNYTEATTLAREYSRVGGKVWICHFIDSQYVIGRSLGMLKMLNKTSTNGGLVVIGHAIKGKVMILEQDKKSTLTRIASTTHPNKIYTITVDKSGKIECTCPGFLYRKHCKHIDKYLANNHPSNHQTKGQKNV